jgi:hypothetical protein
VPHSASFRCRIPEIDIYYKFEINVPINAVRTLNAVPDTSGVFNEVPMRSNLTLSYFIQSS